MVRIDLGGLYSVAGGFMNYQPDLGAPFLNPFIAAIAADGTTVLEIYDLTVFAPISTPGGVDAGAFRGIARASADIRYLEFGGSFAALHDLTLAPEPSSALFLASGLLAAYLARRRLTRNSPARS